VHVDKGDSDEEVRIGVAKAPTRESQVLDIG
jgi:hypothetical protein